MDIDLQSVEEINLTHSERAIFNVLQATLLYPASPQAKCARLADDIEFCCGSREGGVNVNEILWQLWSLLIDIACCIPPGHSWQDILLQSLDILRRRDGAIPQYNEVRDANPTYTGEQLSEDFAKWKSLNTFIARLTSTGFAPWLNLPIWQLKMALEESPVKGPAMECRLWVASEWIIQCAHPIFEDLNSKEELDESTARSLRTGPLCDNIPPMSLERWEYWKKRFSELATDAGSLGLDGAIDIRISDALKSMDAVR
ncbi:MAG: hypothetical protein Q9172_007401 [Xanthocarpia lactea]